MKQKGKKASLEAKDESGSGKRDWANGEGPSEMGQSSTSGSDEKVGGVEGNKYGTVFMLLKGYLSLLVTSGDGVRELIDEGSNLLNLVEDTFSNAESPCVEDVEERFRQFLRNSDEYERSQEGGDREDSVNYLRNFEIECLSLLHSLKQEDGSDQAETREILGDISEGVAEIIEIFSEGSSKPDDLCDEGSAVLDSVKAAIDDIGKKDIRQLDKNLSSKELSSGWEGTLEQNKRADYLVAAAIRNSFKLYEKNKSSVDVSYFNF